MISAFRMGPAANGRGLCDIGRVLFTLSAGKRNAENMDSLLGIGHPGKPS